MIEADDHEPHLRGGDEGALRSFIVFTGRAMFVLHMAIFARPARRPRRSLLGALAIISAVHGIAIRRLYRLYREEGRDRPPAPRAGALHGFMGYVSFAALIRGELQGDKRLTTAAEWYPYLGLGLVDVLDGAFRRRRRPLRDYLLLSGLTVIAGAMRWRSR